MSFMQPQIEFNSWFKIETTHGTWFVPELLLPVNPRLGDFQDYVEGVPQEMKLITGYGARMSAPGFLDCTEWTVFATEKEAQDFLTETYMDDEEDWDPDLGEHDPY